MTSRSVVRRGFTLVELMIVVTIIGILASVAIPSFTNYRYRAKATERDLMVNAIQLAVEDYYVRYDGFPENFGGGFSMLWCNTNPPGAVVAYPRAMSYTMGDDWKSLSLQVSGNVIYQYMLWGTADRTTANYWIFVTGDLDGDGVQYFGEVGRTLTSGAFQTTFSWPQPGTPQARVW